MFDTQPQFKILCDICGKQAVHIGHLKLCLNCIKKLESYYGKKNHESRYFRK